MQNWKALQRVFVASRPLQAVAIALLASMLAKLIWLAAPATYSAWDWALYDAWLSHRPPIAVSPKLAVIARDPASDDRFGVGPLDRGMLAQLVTAVHEGGAEIIGLDHGLDHAGFSQEGGATGDALLLESITSSGPVVTVFNEETIPLAAQIESAHQGHLLLIAHGDHVARAIPLTTEFGNRVVPAFGQILHTLDRSGDGNRGRTHLLNIAGNGSAAAFSTIPLSLVWDAVQRHEDAAFAGWFKEKIVIILPNSLLREGWLLPTGEHVPAIIAHLHLLNSLLTGQEVVQVEPAGRTIVTLAFTSLIAWALLRFHRAFGLMVTALGVLFYLAVTFAALAWGQFVLPVVWPVTAVIVALFGTVTGTQLIAGRRMLLLDQDRLTLQQDSAAVPHRGNSAAALLDATKGPSAGSTDLPHALSRIAETLQSELLEVQAQKRAVQLQLEQSDRHLASSVESICLEDPELEQLREECRRLGIVTQDAGLLRMFRDVKRGAESPLTVLLLGEPGTGKELFARAVHRLSQRAGKAFVAVNMAAISPELFESELFGHTKGSFSGATMDRRGYFELARHGTIFLDEIGDLRLDHQSKLLRVLQEKSFYRVGASTLTMVDVRIIAATNRDLQRGVSEGWFREDLYYRLNGLVFQLPPLRERRGDIPVIVKTSLAEISQQMGRPAPEISNGALRLLNEHHWPGNVRELRHTLERAMALNDGPILTEHSFALEGKARENGTVRATSIVLPHAAGDAAVLNCLRQHGFDMQAAAKALGCDRSTVTQRLKGLCFQALVESDGDQASAALAIAGDPGHLRIVELKLVDYYGHLLAVIESFTTADDAMAECQRRFKNLPDRHFASVRKLVWDHFKKNQVAVR